MAADIVLNANAVGDVVTYVAPGFLAYTGYRLRYPGVSRAAGEVLITSVVASLPLVALVMALLPGAQKPSQLGCVAILLALAGHERIGANWRRRVCRPAAIEAGVTGDLRRYRLRGSFVSLLLWEGHSLTYVAEQAGHSIATLARHYAGTMRELETSPASPRLRRFGRPAMRSEGPRVKLWNALRTHT